MGTNGGSPLVKDFHGSKGRRGGGRLRDEMRELCYFFHSLTVPKGIKVLLIDLSEKEV
jgi:hypothetical protein